MNGSGQVCWRVRLGRGAEKLLGEGSRQTALLWEGLGNGGRGDVMLIEIWTRGGSLVGSIWKRL